MIHLEKVTKIFRQADKETKALDNISLHIHSGQIFGIIGMSGAGKSTLIRCVNLLERPTEGKVTVAGQDLSALSSRPLIQFRRQIGMIFQHFNLLSSRTVFANVALPLELVHTPFPEIKKRVNQLLELVGLGDMPHRYPQSLSGGQKQRVAIARALATQPKILLCDEATSALDPATTRSILNLLRNINKEYHITILLITHEMDIVKSLCDEVAILQDGKLIEQGSVSGLFSTPKTELAQQYIASVLHIEIPQQYKRRLGQEYSPSKHPLLKLEISGSSADIPVLSVLSRQYNVDFQIVSSQLDYAGDTKFGVMLVELIAQRHLWEDVLLFFKENNIKTTMLGYV